MRIDETDDWFLSRPLSRRKADGAVWLLAGLLLLLNGPIVSLGQTAGAKPCEREQSPPMFSVAGTSEEMARGFLVALQKAVAADDRRKVASMVRYPIVTWARDRNVLFKTAASLVPSYELIFTPALKKTIAEARTECLFTNWKGVMIHDGEIWMGARSEGDLQIIAINRPVRKERHVNPSTQTFKVHPKVFSLIENWESDSEYPVVTEVNLDAVAENDNQFPADEIKREGEWLTCATNNGRGFRRHRIFETAAPRYTVEYQENDE
jgi:hypothetical protein